MIGDDDFFMQNADYHYGASDTEKMYGRNYDDSDLGGYYPRSYGGSGSTSQNANSENDNSGKYCLAGILIVLGIIVIATVVVPAVTNAMASSVIVDDLKITRYIHSSQYDSKVTTEKGYEITYNQKSYGTHAINVIFYSCIMTATMWEPAILEMCHIKCIWMKKRITQYLKYTEPIWIMASAYIVKELMLTMLM